MTRSGDDAVVRVACVGGIVHDAERRVLLIRRGQEPGRGRWSLPGGRVEPGEDEATAVVRELAEETGLEVRPGLLAGRVVRFGVGGEEYRIADYHATVIGGALRAGDDADDARWCSAADLAALPIVDGLMDALDEWDALPD